MTVQKGNNMARKKITPELIEKAGELAHHGFSDKQIHEAVDISHTAFYRNVELVDTVKEKRQELRQKVADALLESAVGGDTASLIFLSKRLGLHQSIGNYKKGSLKTAKDAIIELEKLYHASVDGDAPMELINATVKILNDFVKAYDAVDLEDRIVALEKRLDDEKE